MPLSNIKKALVVLLGVAAFTLAATAPVRALVPGIPDDPPAPVWRLGIGATPDPVFGGLRITAVDPGSPAERIGLEVGDVIVQVNGRPIYVWADLQNALANSRGYLRMRVWDSRTGTYFFRSLNLNLP
jgi:S1-C subfamily serine protease